MEFKRMVRINAPVQEVWSLIDDLEAVAGCIPGVSDFQMKTPQAFTCRLSQRVGSVKANFQLRNELKDIEAGRGLTVVSEGKDKALNSSVRATQTFELSDQGDESEVSIAANIQVTGRIATFGHRIILARAEQVTVEALDNVSALLEKRRAESQL